MTLIRPAGPSDAAALAALAESTFRATFGPHNPAVDVDQHCARAFGDTAQAREISDTGWSTLLAEADGALVAFAQLRWRSSPACVPARLPGEIHRLYVRADHHGRGVAQDLIGAAIKKMAERKSDAAWLGVWEDNPRAIAFYRKLGFRPVGEHTFMFGTNPQRDVVMARAI